MTYLIGTFDLGVIFTPSMNPKYFWMQHFFFTQNLVWHKISRGPKFVYQIFCEPIHFIEIELFWITNYWLLNYFHPKFVWTQHFFHTNFSFDFVNFWARKIILHFKQVRISQEINWYPYQSANTAPTAIVQHGIKTDPFWRSVTSEPTVEGGGSAF